MYMEHQELSYTNHYNRLITAVKSPALRAALDRRLNRRHVDILMGQLKNGNFAAAIKIFCPGIKIPTTWEGRFLREETTGKK